MNTATIINEPYDQNTPGRACTACNSAWPAHEPEGHSSWCPSQQPATLEQLGVFFDAQPTRTREISKQMLRDARALGWRPTFGKIAGAEFDVIWSGVQLEVNEGACSHEAGIIAVYESAEDYAAYSTVPASQWRSACLGWLADIVAGPEQ